MTADKENPNAPAQVRLEDLVKGAVRLVSLPEVVIKVIKMVGDPGTTANMLAKVISADPALTARLLRVANSPLYGFPVRIDTINRAITLIGTRGLRDLTLAYSAIDALSRFKDGVIDMGKFWRRSLFVAIIARLLAVRRRVIEAEALFVAGLLHDIGQMIIVDKLPEMARETHLRAKDNGMQLHVLERAAIGFDHAEVGGELLRQWLLPESIWEAVKCHHAPGEARHNPLNAALVHIAAVVENSSRDGSYAAPLSPQDETALAQYLAAEVDPIAWAVTGLTADVVITLYREAADLLVPLAETMLPKTA